MYAKGMFSHGENFLVQFHTPKKTQIRWWDFTKNGILTLIPEDSDLLIDLYFYPLKVNLDIYKIGYHRFPFKSTAPNVTSGGIHSP